MKKSKKKKILPKPQTIRQFIKTLVESDKSLLKDYIEYEYLPKVKTGKGKINNFLKEHNSKEGIIIVKEILKFKKLYNP